MPAPHYQPSIADQLRLALQNKQRLYQKCYALTLRIDQALEDGDGDHVLRLFKQREVIFHKVRDLDALVKTAHPRGALSQKESALGAIQTQIRRLIEQIVVLDGNLHQKMAAKRIEAQQALNRARHKRRLAIAYGVTGAQSARFIDAGR